MSSVIAYLSLGSNLGNRDRNISRAQEELERLDVQILRTSSTYETEPQDVLDQPSFLNSVLQVATTCSPFGLLDATRQVEDTLGRDRGGVAKGPRLIDIDILLFGELVLNDERLTIPHPRMPSRRFVLEPLLEIASDLRHPITGVLWRDVLACVTGQAVVRVSTKKRNSSH